MGIHFSPFDIGRRALQANQLGIAITGHNIANVNTPGYTRQSVQLSASPVKGVTIEGVRAFRDNLIENRLQTETAINARLNARREALTPVEAALTETDAEGGGINAAMSRFFGSWRDLEAKPDSVPLRAVVAEQGAQLGAAFRSTATRLSGARQDTVAALQNTADDANRLAARVAQLNTQIGIAEGGKVSSAELRDERAGVARELSDLVGTRSVENPDGSLTLTLGDGQPLVIGAHAAKLDINGENLIEGTGNELSITVDGQSTFVADGKARGLIDALTEIDKQTSALDNLAAALHSRVNNLHGSGANLDGEAGAPFFAVPANSAPVTAANLEVNPDLRRNPRLVVASPQSSTNAPNIAGSIADLLNSASSTINNRTQSFAAAFSNIVGETGASLRATDDALATQGIILQQVTAQRDAASGVSLDEEAINLLQYQKAYEAAARFIKIADEMTQTIISLGQ